MVYFYLSKLSDSVDTTRQKRYNEAMDHTKAHLYGIFKQFGLDEKETAIYLEALKHDELTPFALAKLTKIPRTSVYDAIMHLSLKGLVELVQSDGMSKQQTKIKAKNPSTLRTILQKKRDELASLEWDILNVLPFLKQDFHQDKTDANVQFYPGIEGAKKVYQLGLSAGGALPILSFDYQFESDIFGSAAMDTIVDKSITVGAHRNKEKRIVPLTNWTKDVLTYQVKRNPQYLSTREIRSVDNPSFFINQRIEMIGNWVSIVSVKEKEIWGLVIHSKLLAQSLASIFYMVWAQAAPITLDLVKSWGEHPFERVKKPRVR